MLFQPNLIANVSEPMEHGNLNNAVPLPPITHYIGHFRYPLTTSRRSSVFLAHHPANKAEPLSGPVRRLTFLHVGSSETPNLFPYSRTCNSVEFSGHLSSTNVVFGVLAQLPKVKYTTVFIGPSQNHYFSEAYTRFSECPGLKKLKIVMDLDYFYSFQHEKSLSSMQYSLIHLVESLLLHAKDSFPNLRNLIVELPENDRLCNAVQNLIMACPGLRKKMQAEVQQVPSGTGAQSNQGPTMSCNGEWQGQETGNRFVGRHRTSDFDLPSHFNHIGGIAKEGSYIFGYTQHYQPTYSSSARAQFSLFDGGSGCEEVPQLYRPQPHRPPPGFSTLPILARQEYNNCNEDLNGTGRNTPPRINGIQEMNNQKQDLHQRVCNWLSSLER